MSMQDKLNKNVCALPPSGIRKFFDIVNDMPDAISLGVGEPDFVTPWSIRDAAIKSVQRGYTQYSSNWGLPKLREEIALYLNGRYNLNYDGLTEILVTVGASEAIDLAMRSIVEAGDEVLIPEPSYVSYAPCVLLSGGKPVSVKLGAESGFKLTPETLTKAITKKTKALILPYPNNPTGAVMEREYLEAIAPLIIKHDLFVISDEIYSELTYTSKHVSIAELPGMRERTVVINGFSKSFAMTGWRLGYIACPKEIITPMVRIHQYVIMCAPTVSQYAALEALRSGRRDGYSEVERMKAEYDVRRRYLYSAMSDLGLSCFEPKGAFYIFPSVKVSGMCATEFAEKLLYSQQVAVIPGAAFSSEDSCVRCCYASSMKNLRTSMERIETFLESLKG